VQLLLDTHVFLWAVTDSRKLTAPARATIGAAAAVFVSAASIWEVAIKSRLGKLKGDPTALADAIEASGFLELPITSRHAAFTARLPLHHSDPFDRLIVAQALSEPLVLLTADPLLSRYGELVRVI
jgi:PIN domain nuclease of toxin-antitoxin system